MQFVRALPFEDDIANKALAVIREHKTRGKMRPIYKAFREWLDTTIMDHANMATLTLAPVLPSDQLYEHIVTNRDLRATLQAAAAEMEPYSTFADHRFKLPVHMLGLGEYIGFELTMPVPKEWGSILFPAESKRALLGPNNMLTELMRPCLTAAQGWMCLRYTVNELLDAVNDRGSIRHLFPWIVEAINESEWRTNKQRFYRNHGIASNKAERENCDRSFNEALLYGRGEMVRTTATIRNICTSGSRLFSQVRMLKAVDERRLTDMQMRTIDSSSLVPNLTKALMPKAVKEELEAVKEYYNQR